MNTMKAVTHGVPLVRIVIGCIGLNYMACLKKIFCIRTIVHKESRTTGMQ